MKQKEFEDQITEDFFPENDGDIKIAIAISYFKAQLFFYQEVH